MTEVRTYLDRGKNKCVCGHAAGKAKVAELDEALLAQQNVLWFHVTVQDTMRVQVKQSRHQLRCNRLNLLTVKNGPNITMSLLHTLKTRWHGRSVLPQLAT